MNKSLWFLTIPLLLGAKQAICGTNKMEKLEAIFSSQYKKQRLVESLNPMIAQYLEQFAFVNEETKQATKIRAFEAYYDLIRKTFVEEFGKRFEERELDEILVFYDTAIGKKLTKEMFEVQAAVGSAAGRGFATLLSEVVTEAGGKPKAQAASAEQEHACTAVVYFEDLTKKDTKIPAGELFEKIIAQAGVCVVKFSAAWCPPCRAYKPVFEAVAEQYKELNKCAIKYVAVDADQSPTVAQAYKVASIPATIFFRNGKEVMRHVGALSKEVLVAKLQEIASAQ